MTANTCRAAEIPCQPRPVANSARRRIRGRRRKRKNRMPREKRREPAKGALGQQIGPEFGGMSNGRPCGGLSRVRGRLQPMNGKSRRACFGSGSPPAAPFLNYFSYAPTGPINCSPAVDPNKFHRSRSSQNPRIWVNPSRRLPPFCHFRPISQISIVAALGQIVGGLIDTLLPLGQF